MTDTSEAVIARILALHPKLIDLSLGRMHRLLAALGSPERRLPPVVHVAGTNGKGSTIAFMRAILEAAGLAVHVYTSPHLVRFHERFRIGAVGGGRLVAEDRLADALLRCEAANAGQPLTGFEVTTAAGLLLFAESPADVLLLEVGLGGRFDATNVVDRPACAVVTPVGHDHAEFLGTDLAGIAREKAGILKRGCPAVIAPQHHGAADAALAEEAERVGAVPVLIGNQDFAVHTERGRLVYQDERGLLDLPLPRLPGAHQLTNAGTAIAALRAAGFAELAGPVYETGLLSVSWPARLQRLARGPLVALLPEGADLWLDGGHNADGGRVAAAAMADLEERNPAPLVLVTAMLANKDADAYLTPFRGLARDLIAVPMREGAAARDPAALAEAGERVGLRARVAPGLEGALRTVSEFAWEEPPRVLICGSLHFAGEVLAANETPPV